MMQQMRQQQTSTALLPAQHSLLPARSASQVSLQQLLQNTAYFMARLQLSSFAIALPAAEGTACCPRVP
jgi:hypothetical protein